ncbi:hypothetical protein EO087_04260 [Dyella sp. M7H15-1]|nr:hypothetical protein EO087_04260 [Dyella sp. M7H15-1]
MIGNSSTQCSGYFAAGYDGFAPIAAYLGGEAGYCLALELRDGIQHSAKETEYTLERMIPRARALTRAPILLRCDSGFDSERMFVTAARYAVARKQGNAPGDACKRRCKRPPVAVSDFFPGIR